jgi:hypothetical protein
MDERDKEDVAAWSFVALLALVGGGVGLVIAALAVGTQRAWQGRAGGGQARAARRQEFLGDQRAWSAQDGRRRAAWREQRRQWWSDGADPATRPARESWWRRFGTWWHRRWARAVVAAEDFRDGWEAGWEAAEEARRDGAGWRTAGARPDPDATDGLPSDEETPDPLPTEPPQPTPEAPSTDGPADGDGSETPADGPEQTAEDSSAPKVAETVPAAGEPNTPTDDDIADQFGRDSELSPPSPVNRNEVDHLYGRKCSNPWCQCQQPADRPTNQPEPTNGGNTMTAPVQTAAPQGETNLDMTAVELDQINAELAGINDEVDALSARKARLAAKVQAASERVTANGGTAATVQALDAATAVVNQLGQHLGGVSAAATDAADQTETARSGLTPALDAQDTLHSAGATGQFVSAATD